MFDVATAGICVTGAEKLPRRRRRCYRDSEGVDTEGYGEGCPVVPQPTRESAETSFDVFRVWKNTSDSDKFDLFYIFAAHI